MPKQQKRRYEVIEGPDVDLEAEDVRDVRGNRITEAYVEEAVARGHEQLAARPGRPSLSGPGRTSPPTSVRLPEALKAAVEARAEAEGRKPAELIREAIEQYLAR